MAYITNDGSKLIERARTEGKSIVFGSVRMNTIYKSDPTSLVQQTDEWFGENHGTVVGCISHVSVNEVSQVCDSKLAVQCNDNSVSWKSIGIYAHLDGEVDELLFACESIENGEYKDVTIVEIPVTLDGVVADFGLSEGGSGGGGGGEVPANMMTTNTEQVGLSGMKTWVWDIYTGGGTVEEPQEGDRRDSGSFSIGSTDDGHHIPLALRGREDVYSVKVVSWLPVVNNTLKITAGAVTLNGASASWDNILKAARIEQGFDHASIRQRGDGSFEINGVPVVPIKEVKIGDYALFVIDSNSKIASVHATTGGVVLDVSVAVFDSGSVHRVNGIVNSTAGLSFDAPITPAEGQEIYVNWTRYDNI